MENVVTNHVSDEKRHLGDKVIMPTSIRDLLIYAYLQILNNSNEMNWEEIRQL